MGQIEEYARLTSKMNRHQSLAAVIERFGLKVGVEVGVLLGYFSESLLASGLQQLVGVDIEKLPRIIELQKQYEGRFEFIEKDSIAASEEFDDESLCLVYLDGDHSDYVLKELRAWSPKIRKGGILSGHDFIIYEHPQLSHYRVVESVFQFCAENNLEFWINGLTSTTKSDIMNRAVEIGTQQKQVELGRRTEHVEINNWFIRKE